MIIVSIYLFYPGFFKVDPVLTPEPVFVWLGLLVAHMPHVDVHQCGAGKEMICFTRDDSDFMVTVFAQGAGGSDTRDAIANDYYVHRKRDTLDR